MIAALFATALAAEPALPIAAPGQDDYTLGVRATRTGLWLGAAGIGAAAVGFPVTVVGAMMSFDSPQPGAGVVTGVGVTLLLGGSLVALAGPFVCAAGEFQARRGLADPPGDALPWVVAGGGTATILVAATAVVAGQDGSRALPFLAVGGATLVGSYVVAAVDLGVLGQHHRLQVGLVPTGNGAALVGTF